jgi:NADPH2:quinone reductase
MKEKKMKAVMMTAIGGPEVLQTKEIKTPTSKNNELLIKLHAAGINPVDYKLRRKGTRYPDKLPAILGCDGAGVVEKVGQNVTKFKLNDEVYFCHGGIGDHPGNYAEYAIIDEKYAARKPKSLTFVEAAAAPLVLITAWESLFDRIEIKKGQIVLIHAGAGGVGHVAIQLAKTSECNVLTTVGSQAKAEFVTSLGADEAILYKENDFVEAVLKSTKGRGVDVVLDTVGGEVLKRSLEAVRIYGNLVTVLGPPEDMDWNVARVRNVGVSFELMLTPMTENLSEGKMHQAQILDKCAQLIDKNKLTIKIDRVFPLQNAAEAHDYLENNSVTGKVVLEI